MFGYERDERELSGWNHSKARVGALAKPAYHDAYGRVVQQMGPYYLVEMPSGERVKVRRDNLRLKPGPKAKKECA